MSSETIRAQCARILAGDGKPSSLHKALAQFVLDELHEAEVGADEDVAIVLRDWPEVGALLRDWKGRVEEAEADRARLQQQVEELKAELVAEGFRKKALQESIDGCAQRVQELAAQRDRIASSCAEWELKWKMADEARATLQERLDLIAGELPPTTAAAICLKAERERDALRAALEQISEHDGERFDFSFFEDENSTKGLERKPSPQEIARAALLASDGPIRTE